MRAQTEEEANKPDYKSDGLPTPSIHDLYITAVGRSRRRLVDLDIRVMVSASRESWKIWELWSDNDGNPQMREIYDGSFMLDVDGFVIHDSMVDYESAKATKPRR